MSAHEATQNSTVWWNRWDCGKSSLIAPYMKCIKKSRVVSENKRSSASGSPLITKPGRASGQLKLPTGEHSKRLSSMNIHPEAQGRFYNIELASLSRSGSISLPSVSSPALSLYTKAPCLHHFPGQLPVKCLTFFSIVIETMNSLSYSWQMSI